MNLQLVLLAAICIVYGLSEAAAATRGQCERRGGRCDPKGNKRCQPLPYKCTPEGTTCCKKLGQGKSAIRKKIIRKRNCKTKKKCSRANGQCVKLTDTCDGTTNDGLCKGNTCTCCIPESGVIIDECTCGEINTNRIVGGVEVDPQNKYPFMVGIIDPSFSGTGYVCGGSIINDRYVLSAEHCFPNPKGMQVGVGDHNQVSNSDDISDVTQIIDIDKVIKHKKRRKNDIALVRLAETLNLVDYPQIKPVCLPSDPSNDFGGETCTAIGWGVTEYGDYDVPDILREVDMTVVPSSECTGQTVAGVKVKDNMVCALVDGGGKDACQGDSGGPLTVSVNGKQVLIGIVSFGEGCGDDGIPGVYTRVSSYLDWINENTADGSYCA